MIEVSTLCTFREHMVEDMFRTVAGIINIIHIMSNECWMHTHETNCQQVSREFHPNFSAKWRRYLYIFPFTNGDESELENYCHKDADCKNIFCTQDLNSNDNCERSSQFELDVDEDGIESGNKPTKFEVGKINQIMQQLEGKLLSYKMFARDTKASRNT